MPVARTRSVALLGLTGSIVEVEADLSSQLPGISIIGLPDAALAEARERVRSAATNAGCPLPQRKLTVNLSPAALPKHGSGFDLAIAVACLAAAGELSVESVDRVVHLGELGLDGRLRPIDGILPAVLAASRAGHDTVMVPSANTAEAALVPGVEVIGVASLLEAAIRHGGEYEDRPVEPVPASTRGDDTESAAGDLADVAGNDDAVAALLTAAARTARAPRTNQTSCGRPTRSAGVPASTAATGSTRFTTQTPTAGARIR
jgi:magnesium chelatase family protein